MADISSISSGIPAEYLNKIMGNALGNNGTGSVNLDNNAFSDMLSSAMNMVNETNTQISNSELTTLNFALGNSENSHDLAISQQKASVMLQYTVTVKNKILEAYKEIMNMQV